jgi:hypothetical protein
MYSLGTYGNTSFVVFPYLSRVEMTNRQSIHGIAKLDLANMMDYVHAPGRRLLPRISPNLDKWKLRYEERRRISLNDVSW